MKCNRCNAEWSAGSTNSEDAALETLLKALANVGNGLGVCQLGDTDLVMGTGVTDSQQYHADLNTRTIAAMDAVHAHIQENYEED